MFTRLEKARSLTTNQMRIVAAAIIGGMPEFSGYHLIAIVLALIINPWRMTGGMPAVIPLSSGAGAILGGEPGRSGGSRTGASLTRVKASTRGRWRISPVPGN